MIRACAGADKNIRSAVIDLGFTWPNFLAHSEQGRILHGGFGERAFEEKARDFQHGSGSAIHEQPIYRTA